MIPSKEVDSSSEAAAMTFSKTKPQLFPGQTGKAHKFKTSHLSSALINLVDNRQGV